MANAANGECTNISVSMANHYLPSTDVIIIILCPSDSQLSMGAPNLYTYK